MSFAKYGDQVGARYSRFTLCKLEGMTSCWLASIYSKGSSQIIIGEVVENLESFNQVTMLSLVESDYNWRGINVSSQGITDKLLTNFVAQCCTRSKASMSFAKYGDQVGAQYSNLHMNVQLKLTCFNYCPSIHFVILGKMILDDILRKHFSKQAYLAELTWICRPASSGIYLCHAKIKKSCCYLFITLSHQGPTKKAKACRAQNHCLQCELNDFNAEQVDIIISKNQALQV